LPAILLAGGVALLGAFGASLLRQPSLRSQSLLQHEVKSRERDEEG